MFTGVETTYKIVGMENIKIKMYNGAMRTLTQVRHVPDLKRNLLSLRTLDSKGCKTIIGGRTIKIWKKTRLVIKGKKLYVLEDDTMARIQPNLDME